MSQEHERISEVGEELRLHLNEHTGGAPPVVMEALRRMTAKQAAVYPDYERTTRECAAYFGVSPEQLLLTNGLDEGILAASVASLSGVSPVAEAIIVQPAFDMHGACSEAAGGRLVAVQLRADFSFPLDEVINAISDATRLVFLTNPNNPTGQRIPHDDIRAILRAVPPGALVFLDEAYAEFCGESFLDELDRYPQLAIGRTFSKAYGLAAFRIGALMAAPVTLAPIRRVVPPYSVNGCAIVALSAALTDLESMRRYVDETERSKQLIYDACQRLGLDYWPSWANFVLVRIGDRASRIVDELAARRIHVRDRSREPGCAGCIRMTAGIVEHTKLGLAALEDAL